MSYSLAQHVSYGLVGGRAVMLDLVADRYLRLGASDTATLLALSAGSTLCSPPHIKKLLSRGLIRPGPGEAIAPVIQSSPAASALECDMAGGGISAFEVLWSSMGAFLAMRALGLARTVTLWRKLRSRCARREAPFLDDLDRAAYVARGFAEARIAVPMPRLCVPDSLALARHLWTRGLAADVYFGVQLDPLLAHAWVQSGALVLSDPLNIAADYTPVFKL
jgi:hypothetical protein